MKLGFFTFPVHPKNKDYRKSLKEDQETIILAINLVLMKHLLENMSRMNMKE